jgi:hypothetical protein
MRLPTRPQTLALACLIGLLILGQPGRRIAPTPPTPPTPAIEVQPIEVVIVENALATTPAIDAAESAIQKYCDERQDKRYRRFDAEKSRRPDGSFPAGYERFFEEYRAAASTVPRLNIVSHATGATLWTGPVPSESEVALALVKRYGGG